MNLNLEDLDIQKLHQKYKSGEVQIFEIISAYKKNIDEKNKDLNIFLSVFEDLKEQSEKAQKMFEEKKETLLTGIPIAIKANILILGKNTNCGSKILENYTGTYNASVIKKLKKAGAILMGYTNMDEFACGSSTENSAYSPTKNPLNKEFVPGGTSGGSAAAVSANMALVALGTDTGGSVRQPACYTSLVGSKPTYGRVSRFGAVAMGSSLDQISPISKNVEDNKIVLDFIQGKDGKDMTALEKISFEEKVSFKKKIGVPKNFLKNVNSEILKNFENSVEKFKKEGFEIVDIDLDIFDYTLPIYYILMPAELSTNLARFDGIRYGLQVEDFSNITEKYFKTRGKGFGEETKRRILLGAYVLSAGYSDQYYNKAISLREKIKEEYSQKISDLDGIILPTCPNPPFKFGEKTDDPVSMYLEDIFTVSSNIIGNPAISIPNGKIENNFQSGLQILGDFNEETKMFELAKIIEKGEN